MAWSLKLLCVLIQIIPGLRGLSPTAQWAAQNLMMTSSRLAQEDRRLALQAGREGDRGPPKGANTKFKYVRIPADETLEPEEISGHGAESVLSRNGSKCARAALRASKHCCCWIKLEISVQAFRQKILC
jgi:hypothetical protein